LARGQDPSAIRKAAKVARAEEGANTFATIAGELADKKRRDKKAAATLRKFEWFMSFALPALGSRPIDEITARDVLVVLKEGEARGIQSCGARLSRESNPRGARCPAGPKLPATSRLGAFWTPAACVRRASRHPGVQKPARKRAFRDVHRSEREPS